LFPPAIALRNILSSSFSGIILSFPEVKLKVS
jgi:hypothetical protein